MLCYVLSSLLVLPFSSCHVMSGQVTLYPVMWRPFWRTAWWKDVNLFERCNVVDFFQGSGGGGCVDCVRLRTRSEAVLPSQVLSVHAWILAEACPGVKGRP